MEWRVTATPSTRRSSTYRSAQTYSKRFGIETQHRLAQESLALTNSMNACLRYLLFVTSLLLQNVWRYVHWEFVSTVRRGGRRLWKWAFVGFCETLTPRCLGSLQRPKTVPANKPPDERFKR